MEFTNEFLKGVIAKAIDECDKNFKHADEGCDIFKGMVNAGNDYNYQLGRRAVAQEIGNLLISLLGRESVKPGAWQERFGTDEEEVQS